MLSEGPWQFTDTVMKNPNEVYVGKDFLSPGNLPEMRKLLLEFYNQYGIMAESMDSDFLDIDPNTNSFNFLGGYVENKDKKLVSEQTIKNLERKF